jgi:hypothetical protein
MAWLMDMRKGCPSHVHLALPRQGRINPHFPDDGEFPCTAGLDMLSVSACYGRIERMQMEHPAGEADDGSLWVDYDRRLKLEVHGTRVTSDAGYRELNDALGLTDLAGAALLEFRHGTNTRHLLAGLLRQSVFGGLPGYEDVNDAGRLAHDPAMRAVVDRTGLDRQAASTSQMGRFET